MKGITRLPDLQEDDGLVNLKPTVVTVKDYKRLSTGVAHLLSEEACTNKHRVALCGHKEPYSWLCSEIFYKAEWTVYRKESSSGIIAACPSCKERFELWEFGGVEL